MEQEQQPLARRNACNGSRECFINNKCLLCLQRWVQRVRECPPVMCRLVNPTLKYDWHHLDGDAQSRGECVRHRICLLDDCERCRRDVMDYLTSLAPDVYDLHRSVMDGVACEMGGGASSASFDEGAYLAWRYGRYRERNPNITTPIPTFYDCDGNMIYCLRCGNTSGAQCHCYDDEIFGTPRSIPRPPRPPRIQRTPPARAQEDPGSGDETEALPED